MEFDYVPFETLSVLANSIRVTAGVDRFSAPPVTAREFWETTAEACGLDKEEAEELAENVHADFAS